VGNGVEGIYNFKEYIVRLAERGIYNGSYYVIADNWAEGILRIKVYATI